MVFYPAQKLLVSLLLYHLYSSDFCLGPSNFFLSFLGHRSTSLRTNELFPLSYLFSRYYVSQQSYYLHQDVKSVAIFASFSDFHLQMEDCLSKITNFGRICVKPLLFLNKCSSFRSLGLLPFLHLSQIFSLDGGFFWQNIDESSIIFK